MSSLFLGKIGNQRELLEIHAFTRDVPFREFRASEISDKRLYESLLRFRYGALRGGRPIYCTAVNPNTEQKIEVNSHDARPGTAHIVALDANREIVSSLSVAVDLRQKDRGTYIGLPLENRWQSNGYPVGASLDRFRSLYLRRNHGMNRDVKAWELAELYRHVSHVTGRANFYSRLGVYAGCFHLLTQEALSHGAPATFLWVFDAIPPYYNLYRYAGAAVLRDPTIETKPRFLSPSKRDIESLTIDGESCLVYRGEKISRLVQVPIPFQNDSQLRFDHQMVPFIDGLLDIKFIEQGVKKDPIRLSPIFYSGFREDEREKLLLGLIAIGKHRFEELMGDGAGNFTQEVLKRSGIDMWHFPGDETDKQSRKPKISFLDKDVESYLGPV